MAGPSLIATLGANITPFTTKMSEAQKLAEITGRKMSDSMKESPDVVAGRWGALLTQKGRHGSSLTLDQEAAWKNRIQAAKTPASNPAQSMMANVGAHMAGALAVAALTEKVIEASAATLEYAGHINDISESLGISTEDVQAFDNALQLSGSGIDDAGKVFEKLAVSKEKAMAGDEATIKHFRDLGVSVEELKSMNLSETLLKISDAFKGGDVQSLMVPFKELGGKVSAQMRASMTEGLRDAVESAKAFNISNDGIKTLDEIGDKWTEIKQAARAFFAEMMIGTYNLFGNFAEGEKAVFSVKMNWIREVADAYAGIFSRNPWETAKKITMAPWTAIKKTGQELADQEREQKIAKEDKDLREKINALPLEKKVGAMEREIQLMEQRKQITQDVVEQAQLIEKIQKRKGELELAKTQLEEQRDPHKEKREKELADLKKQTDEEERRGKNAAMTEVEKATAIKKQIDMLKLKMDSEKDLVEKAKDGLELQKLKNELSRAESSRVKEIEGLDKEVTSADEQRRKMLRKNDGNSMDKIGVHFGGYGMAPEIAAIDSAQRRESILLRISESTAATRRAVEMIADMDKSPSQSDVKF